MWIRMRGRTCFRAIGRSLAIGVVDKGAHHVFLGASANPIAVETSDDPTRMASAQTSDMGISGCEVMRATSPPISFVRDRRDANTRNATMQLESDLGTMTGASIRADLTVSGERS